MKNRLIFCLFVFVLCGYIPSEAQQKLKFSIASFEQDVFDTSAKDQRFEKIDGSGSRYAIIKVTSNNPDDNLTEYRFNFGNLRSTSIERDGVLWLYVQKNAKWVSISRDGYNSIHHYDLGMTIEAGKNYVMSLTSAAKIVHKQMVKFQVIPDKSRAVVLVKRSSNNATEELLGTVDATGAVAKNLEYGTYTYRVVADNYYTSEGRFVLKDKKSVHLENIKLRPNFAEITLIAETDAEILINGESKGNSLWKGTLKSGTYQIECRKQNYYNSTQFIEVKDDINETIELNSLQPILGNLALTSNPLGANITIDGKNFGSTPQNVDLIIGKHEIILTKTDYKTDTINVEVEENKIVEINKALARIATMTIDSKPSKALLYIDGKNVGYTPYTADIASGDYIIHLQKNKYETFEKRVHLDSSNPDVKIELTRQYNSPKSIYVELNGQVGMSFGVGLDVGGYIYNVNLEAFGSYLFCNEEVYINDVNAPISETLSSRIFGVKIGYGIPIGNRMRITPQVGANLLQVHGKNIGTDNFGLSFGGRFEYAISSHFGISLTPEYRLALNKDDIANRLSEISPKIANVLSGVYVKVGLYLYW